MAEQKSEDNKLGASAAKTWATGAAPAASVAPAAKTDEKKADPKKVADAKAKIESITKKLADIRAKKGPRSEEDKQEIERLMKERAGFRKDTGDSEIGGWISDMMEKAGDMIGGGDGKGFSFSSIAGGLLGLVGAYFVGGIFGEGILGTILKFALAIPFAMYGAKLMNGWFGGESAGVDGQSSNGKGECRTLQLSLDGLEQVRARAQSKNARTDYFVIRHPDGDMSKVGLFPVMGNDIPKDAVSYEALKRYVQSNTGLVTINVDEAMKVTQQMNAEAVKRAAAETAGRSAIANTARLEVVDTVPSSMQSLPRYAQAAAPSPVI